MSCHSVCHSANSSDLPDGVFEEKAREQNRGHLQQSMRTKMGTSHARAPGVAAAGYVSMNLQYPWHVPFYKLLF